MMKEQKQYLARIVYKNGYTHDFWVSEFEVKNTSNGIEYSWVAADPNNKPLTFGANEVAAVWQIGVRNAVVEVPE